MPTIDANLCVCVPGGCSRDRGWDERKTVASNQWMFVTCSIESEVKDELQEIELLVAPECTLSAEMQCSYY